MSENLDAIIGLGISRRVALEIGERIRHNRERTGKSVAEISEHIKIREHYLLAIESGSWNALPQGVNGRGLIRIYARELSVAIPEIEPKISQENTSGEIKVNVVKADSPAASTVRATAAQRSAPPTRSRPPSHSHRSHSREDEDDVAIEASGELASLLGIEQKHTRNTNMPQSINQEIVYENNVPVVNAELLANEMFLGGSEVIASKKQDAIIQQPVDYSEQKTNPVLEAKFELKLEAKSEPQVDSKIHKTSHEEPEAPASEARVEETKSAEKPSESEPMAEHREAGDKETHEIPPAWVQEDISEVMSPVIVKKSEPVANQDDAQKTPQVISNYVQKTSASAEPKEPILSKSLIFGLIGVVAATIFVTVMLSKRPSSSEIATNATPVPEEVVATPQASMTPASVTENATPNTAEPVPMSAAGESSVNPETTQAAITPAPQSEPIEQQSNAGAKPSKAVLSFKQKVAVTIRVDGRQFFSGTHDEGDLEIQFTKSADIYVEDGSKATLNYEGWENHGPLGWAGRKRRVILNAAPYSGHGRGTL